MKSLFLTAFLMFYSCLSFGQEVSHALWSVWRNEKHPTIERLAALEEICKKQYLYTQPDSAYLLAKIGYEFAEKENLKKEMSATLKIMGVACTQLSKYEEAISLQKRGIEINKSINDEEGIAKHLKSIGNVHLKMSNYNDALAAYQEGLDIANKLEDKKLIAAFQNNISLVYFDLKDYDKALQLLNDVLIILKETNNEKDGANALTNIGTIYRKQENYDKALEYYEKSLQLKLDNESVYGLPICYNNLGLVHQKQGNTKKALEYYNLSINLQRKAGNQKGIARALINFGRIYQNSNPDTARVLLNQALIIAEKTNNKEELRDATELLYKVYQEKGEYKKALEMHEIFHALQDSILSVQNQKAILSHEYKIKSKEEILKNQIVYEQKLRETQLHSQRNLFLIIGFVLLVGIVTGLYIRDRHRRILQKRNQLIQKVEKLKGKLATQSVSSVKKRKELNLNKAKIEAAIDNKIGESSWLILNLIFENPSISNKDIAEKVSLSVEGVSSSLRRMYTAFGIKSKGNKKVTLLMRAVTISVQD